MWETFCVIITVIVILGDSIYGQKVSVNFHFFRKPLTESVSENQKYFFLNFEFLQLF